MRSLVGGSYSSQEEVRRAVREEISTLTSSQRLALEAQMGVEIIQRAGKPIANISHYVHQMIDGGCPMRGDTGDPTFLNDASGMFRVARWADYGFNVFQLTHSLAAGLALTEPADINAVPHMPFPCFAVTVPEGIIPFWYGGEQYWADIVWMHRYEAIYSGTGKVETMYRWSVEWRGITLWREHIEGHFEKNPDKPTFWIPGQDEAPVPEDNITEDVSLRLVLNVCSWLASVGGLSEKHQSFRTRNKVKKKKAGKLKKPGPMTWILGREVKLDKAVRDAATDFVLGRSRKPREGWKQRVQSVVRGHFQHYWVGSGEDKKRVPKWKDPYVKNKDASVAYAHLYKDKPNGD